MLLLVTIEDGIGLCLVVDSLNVPIKAGNLRDCPASFLFDLGRSLDPGHRVIW